MKRLASIFFLCVLLLVSCGSEPPVPDTEVTRVDAPSIDAPSTESPASIDTPAPSEPEPPTLAETLCAGMTTAQKVGQLFLVRAETDADTAVKLIEQYHVGGYVLFAAHFKDETPQSMKALTDRYQTASAIPMLIAADEEGGTVTRISRYKQYRSSAFQSPRKILASGGLEAVRADTIERCALLSSLGVNLNLAPCADISTSKSDFIYDRSAGDAETASGYVQTFVEASAGTGVGVMLKHFPGYGDNADTHTGSALDERPYETFVNSDFLPFSAGIEAGAGAVMVSHNVIACIDDENPASLSAEVHRMLREELSFDGVICTDDLCMDAIRDVMSDGEAAVRAIEAGNDLICSSALAEAWQAVYDAVTSGRISQSRLDESVVRILQYKIDLGLIKE
ncbi:MAG: beta-hexosaminidase [Clostridia bacterium]|nr:beta-hexosaminidase [Clostridia bacterium]